MNRNLTDEVWDETLRHVVANGELEIDDLPFDLGERHKARRVLNSMEDMGFLQRESPRAKTWKLGERGEEIMLVSDDAVE